MKKTTLLIALALVTFALSRYFLNPEINIQSAARSAGAPSDTVDKPQAAEPENIPSASISDLISSSTVGAKVFIVSPEDGSTVASPVTIVFGVNNMQIAKAGENIEYSGHHHLLIDLKELPDMTAPLPATKQIVHFGGGQTETTIDLEPGEHTLRLLLGNYLHIPHDKPVLSKEISIIVE